MFFLLPRVPGLHIYPNFGHYALLLSTFRDFKNIDQIFGLGDPYLVLFESMLDILFTSPSLFWLGTPRAIQIIKLGSPYPRIDNARILYVVS